MVTLPMTKELKTFNENKQHLQQMVLIQLAVSIQKNANLSFFISLYKAQVQVDQRPPYKTGTLKLIEEKVGKSLEHIGIEQQWLML